MAMLRATTEGGVVEGIPAGIQAISVFRGVPFATAPVGELRWRPPQPVVPWEEVRACYQFPPIALQEETLEREEPSIAKAGKKPRKDPYLKVNMPMEAGEYKRPATEFYTRKKQQSEDCLYLNVWTPAESPEENLPVAIYIHGGGHFKGYSYKDLYDGEGFAKRGVILVSISYRLNLFGYLAHPELGAENPTGTSSNYGILDQVAAIAWVKRNIRSFGGNPENITVFGQSGGAASVLSMVVTPLTKGLFQRAIMQSGGGLRKPYSPWTSSLQTAEELGVKFLAYMGYSSIAEARAVSAIELLEGFLRFNKLPLGEDDPVSMDGKNYMRFSPVVDGYVLPDNAISLCLQGKHPELDYLLSSVDGEGEIQTIQNLAWAENEWKLGRKPSYLMYFRYAPPGARKAYHSVEHPYVFQTLHRSPLPFTGYDLELSNQLADYWANFMWSGDPNGDGLVGWEPFTKTAPRALEVGQEIRMAAIVETDEMIACKEDLKQGQLS